MTLVRDATVGSADHQAFVAEMAEADRQHERHIKAIWNETPEMAQVGRFRFVSDLEMLKQQKSEFVRFMEANPPADKATADYHRDFLGALSSHINTLIAKSKRHPWGMSYRTMQPK